MVPAVRSYVLIDVPFGRCTGSAVPNEAWSPGSSSRPGCAARLEHTNHVQVGYKSRQWLGHHRLRGSIPQIELYVRNAMFCSDKQHTATRLSTSITSFIVRSAIASDGRHHYPKRPTRSP
eukprot:551498-Rhodomonas_salina.2